MAEHLGTKLCVRCDVRLRREEIEMYGNACGPCQAAQSYNVDVEIGSKFDQGKARYSLVPPDAMAGFVDVLTFGAEKYSAENWKQVPDLQNRYYDALQRHLAAYRAGDKLDTESGLHHLAHAMCCVAFMMQDDVEGAD